jgi:thiol-disulfide isomerase/thioredoxin
MKQLLIFLAFLIGLLIGGLAQSQLPAFSFTDLEGKEFTQQNLETGMATVVMFFDPYCDHCEQQAEWIREAEDKFKDVQFLFVTTEPEQQPTALFREKHFGNTSLEHVHFLIDSNFMFDGYFEGYYEVPSILIYSAEGKRLKVLSKETPAEGLLKYLQ